MYRAVSGGGMTQAPWRVKKGARTQERLSSAWEKEVVRLRSTRASENGAKRGAILASPEAIVPAESDSPLSA